MEFKFETAYNQEALTVMAKTIRKTARKKRNRRSHIFGVIVIILALLLTLPLGDREFVIDFRTILTWLVVAILIFTLIFEDRINGYVARKRMMPGLDKAVVTFSEDGYHSETEIGTSEFKYNTIMMLAETADYFVFVFSQSHAQVYNKKSITGGTVEEFREFIKNATGKEIQNI
ncbi:MAG: YcxB family protein [Ruminococcaceae bacterium]|nr:YcxB family protein [Oscillospiraceae bacterium]